MPHALLVKPQYGVGASTSDGSTPVSFVIAASSNLTMLKTAPGLVTAIHAINVNAAVRYLKFFDVVGAPTVGTTVPRRRYPLPGSTTGAGFTFAPAVPLRFDNGIWLCVVTGILDTDASSPTASDGVITVEYV